MFQTQRTKKAVRTLEQMGFEWKPEHEDWYRTIESMAEDNERNKAVRQDAELRGRVIFAGKVMDAFGLRRKYIKASRRQTRDVAPVHLFIEDIDRALDTQQNSEATQRIAEARPQTEVRPSPQATPAVPKPSGVIGFVAEG